MFNGQDFQAWCPATILQKGGRRVIQGFISTEHEDRDTETVLQDGLDFDEALKYGYFNDNHSKATRDILGYPTKIIPKITPDGRKGHWVEGVLFDDYEPSDAIWKLNRALQKDGKRRLGFSLQGKIVSRAGPTRLLDGKQVGRIVTKAIVRHIAITPSPVNPHTGMQALTKALMAGNAVSAPAVRPGEGFPLRPESLEGGRRYRRRDVLDLMIRSGYSARYAESVWELAKQLKGD